LQREQTIKLEKYPGKEIEIEIRAQLPLVATKPLITIYRARLFLVNQRVYMIHAAGKPEFASSKDATRFLASLKLAK